MKSDWKADKPDANGDTLWRHPSGAETVIASTMKDAARRKALSRALIEHLDPGAIAREMAQKRADNPKSRERERRANALAMAEKRAEDPEWRERERQVDALAKAQKAQWERSRPLMEKAHSLVVEAARIDARRSTRFSLQSQLMLDAGLRSPQVIALAKLWAGTWPWCVMGCEEEQLMVDSLQLDDPEYVMNLADHCSAYIEWVEVHAAASLDNETLCASRADGAWWRSAPHADGRHFVGLTSAEARSLEDACMRWLDAHVVWDDDPDALLERMLKEERYRLWTCSVGDQGCLQTADAADGVDRWSCEQCNWEWNICTACMGEVTRATVGWPGDCIACQRNSGIWGHTFDYCPGTSAAIRGHPHSEKVKSVDEGTACTGQQVRIAAARARGMPFVKADWVSQPIPKPPEYYQREWCCQVYMDDGCTCWFCLWVEESPAPEAVRHREHAERRARYELRELERKAAQPVVMSPADCRRMATRRIDERLAALTPTERALHYAKRAQEGLHADMTKDELRERLGRSDLVVRIQEFARGRRVRTLTRRHAAEMADAEAAAQPGGASGDGARPRANE